MTTITLTADRQQGLQAECNAYNAANPDAPFTLDQFIQNVVDMRADSSITAYGKVTVFGFLQRLTSAEYGNILAAAQTDPILAAYLADLNAVGTPGGEDAVYLKSTKVTNGLAYLVAKGLLDPSRPAQITSLI
jgi:hypothetical protein